MPVGHHGIRRGGGRRRRRACGRQSPPSARSTTVIEGVGACSVCSRAARATQLHTQPRSAWDRRWRALQRLRRLGGTASAVRRAAAPSRRAACGVGGQRAASGRTATAGTDGSARRGVRHDDASGTQAAGAGGVHPAGETGSQPGRRRQVGGRQQAQPAGPAGPAGSGGSRAGRAAAPIRRPWQRGGDADQRPGRGSLGQKSRPRSRLDPQTSRSGAGRPRSRQFRRVHRLVRPNRRCRRPTAGSAGRASPQTVGNRGRLAGIPTRRG